jgi:hypothetical protein
VTTRHDHPVPDETTFARPVRADRCRTDSTDRRQALSCCAMGAIKPWHVMTLTCVFLVVAIAVVAALVVVLRRR